MNKPEELHVRIGRLRDEARAESTDAPASGRPQMNEVDGAIALANHLSSQHIEGAERRQAIGSVKIGTTVTAQGAAKTLLSRQEKIDRVKALGATWTEDQRDEYLQGEKFEALSDKQQELFAEAFGQLPGDDAEVFNPAEYNFDTELADVESLPDDDDDEADESYVDPVDEAYLNGETYYYTGEESQ